MHWFNCLTVSPIEINAFRIKKVKTNRSRMEGRIHLLFLLVILLNIFSVRFMAGLELETFSLYSNIVMNLSRMMMFSDWFVFLYFC